MVEHLGGCSLPIMLFTLSVTPIARNAGFVSFRPLSIRLSDMWVHDVMLVIHKGNTVFRADAYRYL